jgi:hypothetical protein
VVDYKSAMFEYPVAQSLILVVVMNNPRDFEIARMLGWYRIPIRSAPKVISVDYLAFYQTAAFGDEKWKIDYIAQVRGHELATRKELLRDELDHPHANQEYYKIQIGPLLRLPQPIIAGNWRRITFLYTIGEYLAKAKTINDLVVNSDERSFLWQALRERALQNQTYQIENDPLTELNPEIIDLLLGITNNLPESGIEMV